MKLHDKAEFTNRNKDKVTITLFEDGAGGFHLIIKSVRMRKHEEQRVIGGKLTAIPTTTWNEETKLVQLPNARTALVEFQLYRTTESDPEFGMTEFQAWLIATKEQDTK